MNVFVMRDYGLFTPIIPKPGEEQIVYFTSEEGLDFYATIARQQTPDTVGLTITPDNIIVNAERELSRLVPMGLRVVEIYDDGFPDLTAFRGKAWDPQGIVSNPPPRPYLPAPLTPRQFFVALTKEPWNQITQGEAMAYFKTGTIPGPLLSAIDTAVTMNLLPEGMTRFDVEAMIIAATEYDINNPFVEIISGVLGWTAQETFDFWVFAEKL